MNIAQERCVTICARYKFQSAKKYEKREQGGIHIKIHKERQAKCRRFFLVVVALKTHCCMYDTGKRHHLTAHNSARTYDLINNGMKWKRSSNEHKLYPSVYPVENVYTVLVNVNRGRPTGRRRVAGTSMAARSTGLESCSYAVRLH